ncbi:ExeM/NucH family extracellular endonuclease [Luteimonas abyssi]|uniref:ExeM/NucH family extracellular endonuclease n=1 Tax=Luteimonas abyssi TaxID=1247514 RepID=UPI000737B2D7|nr:ExeM/NucH family extracellular endonuclease [Luteimonas abyssi]
MPTPRPATSVRSPVAPSIALALGLSLGGCGVGTVAPAGPAGSADVIAIGEVQGPDARSPLEGRTVAVEGVVTGAFSRHLGGWFVQDGGDGDPATSDALFVLDDTADAPRQGTRVRVHGRVVEHGEPGAPTLTALVPERVRTLDRAPLPAPVVLDAPPDDWTVYEGMRVRIDAPMTLTGHHELARRGVLMASFGDRLYTPTEIAAPGPGARTVADDNARRLLRLDDARADTARRVWYLPDDHQAPRSGSPVSDVEGIVDVRWGDVRLQLTAPLRVGVAARPDPPQVPGDVRVAALNLENLFNGDGHGGGFPTARGARTPEEYATQLARHVATLRALDPDIVALMELENDGDGPESALAALVDALATDGTRWRFVAAGDHSGGDAIRVALIYRADRVRAHGAPATLTEAPFGAGSRVPLAQAFVPVSGGPALVVVANHFKSKGCGEARGADADQGDGQACWNAHRTEAARRLDAWLASDPTGAGSGLTALLGDLNAYAMEDPLRLLRAAGWRDAFAEAGIERPYSYVFNGQAGRLDHALLSPALAARLAGAALWHANADEPSSLGYRDDASRHVWRSSDHDPLLLGFHLAPPH